MTLSRVIIYGMVHYTCMTLAHVQTNIAHHNNEAIAQKTIIGTSAFVDRQDITILPQKTSSPPFIFNYTQQDVTFRYSAIEPLLDHAVPLHVAMTSMVTMTPYTVNSVLKKSLFRLINNPKIIESDPIDYSQSSLHFVQKTVKHPVSQGPCEVPLLLIEIVDDVPQNAPPPQQCFSPMTKNEETHTDEAVFIEEDGNNTPPSLETIVFSSQKREEKNFDVLLNKVGVPLEHVTAYLNTNAGIYDPLPPKLVDDVFAKARENAKYNRKEYCSDGPTHEFYEELAAQTNWFKAGRLAALIDQDQDLPTASPHLSLGGDTQKIWYMCMYNIESTHWTPLFAKAYTYFALDKLLDDQMIELGEDSDDRGYLPEYKRDLPFTVGYISQRLEDDRFDQL
ncbi:MAG: hypothetical protein K2X98_00105 [Alphaproteobacteria bacterium]|nr:hypothetical protein [Alphaproteobacteria bacterium]